MKGHGTKYRHKREAAVAALLNTQTISEAAQLVGISVVSLHRWLREPAFQDLYAEAKASIVQHAIARLASASNQAVEVLAGIMTDRKAPASARVAAAKNILGLTMHGLELESLLARLRKLELAVLGD